MGTKQRGIYTITPRRYRKSPTIDLKTGKISNPMPEMRLFTMDLNKRARETEITYTTGIQIVAAYNAQAELDALYRQQQSWMLHQQCLDDQIDWLEAEGFTVTPRRLPRSWSSSPFAQRINDLESLLGV